MAVRCEQTDLCERLRRKIRPRRYAASIDTVVVTMKNIGMIHSSLSFAGGEKTHETIDCEDFHRDAPGERKKATLEKSRDGVNSETLRRLSCCGRDASLDFARSTEMRDAPSGSCDPGRPF